MSRNGENMNLVFLALLTLNLVLSVLKRDHSQKTFGVHLLIENVTKKTKMMMFCWNTVVRNLLYDPSAFDRFCCHRHYVLADAIDVIGLCFYRFCPYCEKMMIIDFRILSCRILYYYTSLRPCLTWRFRCYRHDNDFVVVHSIGKITRLVCVTLTCTMI